MYKEYLDVSPAMIKKYKELFPKRAKDSEATIQKRLTKDWILGQHDSKQSDEKYSVRRYGYLKMVINQENSCVIGLFNNKEDKYAPWINQVENKRLKKLYGLND